MGKSFKVLAQWRDKHLLEYGDLEHWQETRNKGFIRYCGRYAAVNATMMVVVVATLQLLMMGEVLLNWFDVVTYSVVGYLCGYFVWRQNQVKYFKQKAQAQLRVADPHLLD